PRDDGAVHLTAGRERVDQRRLSDAGIAGHDNDARALAPGLEPRVVEHAKLALASNQRLRLEPSICALRWIAGRGGPSRGATTVAQQIGHADQFGSRLRPQLLRELGFIARKRLERAAPIARPGPRLHNPANALLGERIEILQACGMLLDGGEITDATRGIHLPHEAIANLRG